jgi:hypothetical protein
MADGVKLSAGTLAQVEGAGRDRTLRSRLQGRRWHRRGRRGRGRCGRISGRRERQRRRHGRMGRRPGGRLRARRERQGRRPGRPQRTGRRNGRPQGGLRTRCRPPLPHLGRRPRQSTGADHGHGQSDDQDDKDKTLCVHAGPCLACVPRMRLVLRLDDAKLPLGPGFQFDHRRV